jgi:hypothetical protein
MLKIKIYSFILLFLISCKNKESKASTLEGKEIFTIINIEEFCYDGVIYLTSPHFSSVKFNKNGKIETCEIKKQK